MSLKGKYMIPLGLDSAFDSYKYSLQPPLTAFQCIATSKIAIRYRPNTKVSDRCLIDADPMVFAIWVLPLIEAEYFISTKTL